MEMRRHYKFKYWKRNSCYKDTFPFHEVDTTDILKENFNSNYACSCTYSNIDHIARKVFFKYGESLLENDKFGPDPDDI